MKTLTLILVLFFTSAIIEAAEFQVTATQNPVAKIAGVWDISGSGLVYRDIDATTYRCALSFSGKATVYKTGEIFISQITNDECLGEFSGTSTGTATYFTKERAGVFQLAGGAIYNYQASKDLKIIIFSSTGVSGLYASGTALRH